MWNQCCKNAGCRGHTVLGIDSDMSLVQRHSHEITQTVALDSTHEEALKEIDISSFDTVVVAIGTNFEANIMTTVALKALNVNRVVCKATTLMQKDILLRIGADRVVLPEYEAGERLASILTTPAVVGQMELVTGKRIAKVEVPTSLVGLNLEESEINSRFNLHVVALLRQTSLSVNPKRGTVMRAGDMLVVIAADDDIRKFSGQI
ncbi:TrkA family potassium uptake protein [Kamptonema cortianum]|nr:TrkA family potassium uptake protein [Kamptonema cortianum]